MSQIAKSYIPYLTAYKIHGCIRRTLISAGQINKNKKTATKKQSTNIKLDAINTMNIINDNSFNLHNCF